MTRYSVSVHITPRRGVLDPQGQAVGGALRTLGFAGVRDVHVGRYVIVEADADSEQAARDDVSRMCERLLANPVIEDFEIATVSAK
ncbi:MAG: purS [Gemmatimonadetes bacterium]|nr:purS [Gemmatimonadota bacterium]